MQTTNPVPLQVRRVIENKLHEQPRAPHSSLNRAVQEATFCEPQQAIEWVGDALRYASC